VIACVAKDPSHQLHAISSPDGCDWSAGMHPVQGHRSKFAPALNAFYGRLALVYVSDDQWNNVLMTFSDDAQAWERDTHPAGQSSAHRPAIDASMGAIEVAYVANDGSGQLYVTSWVDDQWGNPQAIPGRTSSQGPAVTAFHGGLAVGYVAKDAGNALRSAYRIDGSWTSARVIRERDDREIAATLIRAQVLHTPRDPFADPTALEAYSDGAVAFADGQILATGDYWRVRAEYPTAELIDARDGVLLPGLVDTHVHYPQLPVIGAMGLQLLDWLRTRALPEEERFADVSYAGLRLALPQGAARAV